MAEKRLIKEQIRATEKTYQITSAMNMVSTSKLKRSEKSLKSFRPLSDSIKQIMESLLSSNEIIDNSCFKENKSKPCYIVIASDRGLIGNYNNQLLKHFTEYVNKKHKSKDEFYVATIGFKAYSYAKRMGYNLINSESINIRDDILFVDFEEITNKIIKGYKDGLIGKTTAFYTSFVNSLTNKITKERLLPIKLKDKSNEYNEFIFEPDKGVVLNELVNLYVKYTLYRIMLEAKTSEHASRMNAMKNAKDNAKEIEEKLTLLYNHARQNQITTELIDIINGSNAVN